MSETLTSKRCVPCEGGIAQLTAAEAQAMLAKVPGWTLEDGGKRLERRFTFPDFAGAFAFVGKVAEIAERENHHPDIAFGWGYATVSVHTHAIGGLHENDFIVAAKTSEAARQPQPATITVVPTEVRL